MSETVEKSRAISTTLAGAGWLSVTVVLASLTVYFVGLDQGASSVFGSNTPRYTSSSAMPGTCWDSPAASQPGRSERGGDSPELLCQAGVRPGQRAQRHIGRTRIQIALKLTPDRFR
jgi:hypothetical protein